MGQDSNHALQEAKKKKKKKSTEQFNNKKKAPQKYRAIYLLSKLKLSKKK